jgi:urea carboxylase
MQAELDGNPVEFWTPLRVKAGSILRLKSILGNGTRTYLAAQNGFNIPIT